MAKCSKCSGSEFEAIQAQVANMGAPVRVIRCASPACQTIVGLDPSSSSSPLTLSRNTAMCKALVVRGEELKKLDAAIREFAGPPNYRVVKVNGLENRNANLDTVLSLENALDIRIKEIHLQAEATNPWRAISMSMMTEGVKEKEDGKDPPNLFVHIEGPSHSVTDINKQVNLRLAAMSPWYGWATSTSKVSFALLFGLVSLLIYALSKVLFKYKWPADNIRPLIYIAGWIGLAVILGKLQNLYFPRACFLIGQEEERYRTAENVRWAVFISFLLSIVAGAVTTYMLP